MRISDWSSDVCSSDLLDVAADADELDDDVPIPTVRHRNSFRRVVASRTRYCTTEHDLRRRTIMATATKADVRNAENRGRMTFGCSRESGRASCRERVCQSA